MATKRATSLANLAVNAAAAPSAPAKRGERSTKVTKKSSEKVNKLTSEETGSADNRVQVAFRLPKDAYRVLRQHALDEDTTVNELIVRALNEMRERKGLRKLVP